MHSLDNLADHFGLTYNQVRDRVIALQGKFESEFKGGGGAQYRITDNGFKMFERLRTLEESGYNMKSAINELEQDWENQVEERETDTPNSPNLDERYIKNLETQIEKLEKDKKRLQEKVDAYEKRFLPKEKKSVFDKLSDWFGF